MRGMGVLMTCKEIRRRMMMMMMTSGERGVDLAGKGEVKEESNMQMGRVQVDPQHVELAHAEEQYERFH